jgi:signal transduction histidine kinase
MKRDPYVLDVWSQVRFNFFFILGLIVVLGVLRWSFSIGFLESFFVVVAAMSFRLILFKQFSFFVHLKTWFFVGAVFLVFFLASEFLGWLGVVLFLLVILVYKFVKGWSIFMRGMRRVETILFGKPLDKKEWKKGEKPSMYVKECEENERRKI